MPKIPLSEPQLIGESAPSFRQAMPTEFGGRVAGALSNLGDVLERQSEHISTIYQESKANNVIADAHRQLNDYALELKYGAKDPSTGQPVQDEEGNILPPPDPALHDQLYQAKINEIRSNAEKQLQGNGIALRQFYSSFEPTANAALLGVKTDAIGQMHQLSRAQNQEAWQQAATNFVDSPEIARPQIQNDTFASIDRAVASRIITPEEGFEYKKQFVHQSEFGLARKIMYEGPDGPRHLIDSINAGEFDSLPSDQKYKLYDMAINHDYTNNLRAESQLRRQQMQEEHDRKLAGDALTKVLTDSQFHVAGAPAFTPDLVKKYEEFLPPHAYQAFMKAAVSGDETPSDKNAVAMYEMEIYRGNDVRSNLYHARADNVLNNADFGRLLSLNERFGGTLKGDPTAKRYVDLIHAAFGGDSLLRQPKQARAGAEAINEFYSWRQEHPEAKSADLDAKANELIKRGSILGNVEVPFEQLRPKYLDENFNNTSDTTLQNKFIEDAARKTKQAADEGKIGPEELLREQVRLKRFKDMIPKTLAPTPTGK